jgi:hypothetical protein
MIENVFCANERAPERGSRSGNQPRWMVVDTAEFPLVPLADPALTGRHDERCECSERRRSCRCIERANTA